MNERDKVVQELRKLAALYLERAQQLTDLADTLLDDDKAEKTLGVSSVNRHKRKFAKGELRQKTLALLTNRWMDADALAEAMGIKAQDAAAILSRLKTAGDLTFRSGTNRTEYTAVVGNTDADAEADAALG